MTAAPGNQLKLGNNFFKKTGGGGEGGERLDEIVREIHE